MRYRVNKEGESLNKALRYIANATDYMSQYVIVRTSKDWIDLDPFLRENFAAENDFKSRIQNWTMRDVAKAVLDRFKSYEHEIAIEMDNSFNLELENKRLREVNTKIRKYRLME